MFFDMSLSFDLLLTQCRCIATMATSISLIPINGRMTPPTPQTSRFFRSKASAPSGRYLTPRSATGISSGMMIALKITADRIAEVGE